MEEIISAYVSLINKLDEESLEISKSMQGELMELYQKIVYNEKEKLKAMLKTLL